MVVASQHHGGGDAPVGYCVVEGEGDSGASFAVGVEDARLRADDKPVAGGLAYPVEVVLELPAYGAGRRPAHVFEDFSGKSVGRLKVFGAS